MSDSPAPVTIIVGDGGLSRALKMLKRDFAARVVPALRRHEYHLGPGERRRLKSLLHTRRQAKREAHRRAREAASRAIEKP